MNLQDKFPSLLNQKFWWQHYSNSLSMALGKKSFLIRDILESQTKQISTLPSNSSLVEWLIQNRVDNLGQNFNSDCQYMNLESEGQAGGSNAEEKQLACESDNFSSNFALSPFIHNWLSIHQTTPQTSVLATSLPNQSLVNSLPEKPHPFSSSLYQNLYYYAIQQQINASLFDRSPSPEHSFVEQSQSHFEQSTLQSKSVVKSRIPKLKKSKSAPVSDLSPSRKRPLSTSKKTSKNAKKGKSCENDVEVRQFMSPDDSLSMDAAGDAKWNAGNDNGECNCDVNEDSEAATGISNCGDKSKCKKLRRNRTVFTELQLMGLERRFDSQKYLSTPDRADLARALGLTQLQVKTWYQNRRMRWKREVMQNGCPYPPTKPKGRPKKDSIPTYGIDYTNSILCPIFASHSSKCPSSPNPMATLMPAFTPNISPLINTT